MRIASWLMSLACVGAVVVGSARAALAQATSAMPLHRRAAGLLVSDTGQDRIALLRDLNGDGDAEDAGETTTFCDATNALGTSATGSVFAMFQAADGTVYFSDGDTDSVYAAKDLNLDGDALDAGELRVFFSSLNAGGLSLPTPNGITGDGTYVYVANAGVSGLTQDGVYRLRDLDANGDADGPGEASVFLNLQMLLNSDIGAVFDLTFSAATGTFFVADNRDTATPDAIYAFKDTDNSGAIETGEIAVFHTSGMFAGTSGFVQTCVSDGSSIYTHDRTGSINPQKFVKLTDVDSSGTIDAASEVTLLWDESLLPAGVTMATSQALAIGRGTAAIVSSGTGNNVVLMLKDADNDGKYISPGETTAFARSAGFPTTARQVLVYAWACAADFNTAGGVSVQDIFDFLGAWFAGSPAADFNGAGGVTVQDIFDFLAAWFEGCA